MLGSSRNATFAPRSCIAAGMSSSEPRTDRSRRSRSCGLRRLYDGIVLDSAPSGASCGSAPLRHPTAEWIAQQVTEACGWESAPHYLVRDRDRIYGEAFTRRIRAMGIRDRPTAPRSPWQNGYAERFIGSIRRECLDHVIVFSEQHLRRVLRSYQQYYNGTRTHLSLAKDAPLPRSIQTVGSILPLPVLGGLHHHYVRI